MSAARSRGVWRSVDVRDEYRLLRLFQRLREVTRSVAEPGQPDWTSIRFTLTRDGEFHADFGYEPLPPD